MAAVEKEVKGRLIRDFSWQHNDIPNEITLAMHFSHPKWELCNRTMIEQMQQKYDFARAKFSSDDDKNKWIVAYESRIAKNLADGVTDNIDALFEAQDNHFGPERSNYAMMHQAGGVMSCTEIGDDGLPVDVHFDIENVDVDVDDLLEMF